MPVVPAAAPPALWLQILSHSVEFPGIPPPGSWEAFLWALCLETLSALVPPGDGLHWWKLEMMQSPSPVTIE